MRLQAVGAVVVALALSFNTAGCGGGGDSTGGGDTSEVRFENFTGFTLVLFIFDRTAGLGPGESVTVNLESNVNHFWQARERVGTGGLGPIIDNGTVRPDGPAVIFIDGIIRKPSPRADIAAPPSIFLDADTCPDGDAALEVAQRHEAPLFVLARSWASPIDDGYADFIPVEDTETMAHEILARLLAGDIVLTADSALTAVCQAAGARVLLPDGRDWGTSAEDDGEAQSRAAAVLRMELAVAGN
jgi:uncharacterized protein YaiI (UPF0178 family)